MRAKAPRVIDAEFEIVSGVRQKRPGPWFRFGRWLAQIAFATLITGAVALPVGLFAAFVLRLSSREMALLNVPTLLFSLWLADVLWAKVAARLY